MKNFIANIRDRVNGNTLIQIGNIKLFYDGSLKTPRIKKRFMTDEIRALKKPKNKKSLPEIMMYAIEIQKIVGARDIDVFAAPEDIDNFKLINKVGLDKYEKIKKMKSLGV